MEQDVLELALRFVRQRRELGDDFWPSVDPEAALAQPKQAPAASEPVAQVPSRAPSPDNRGADIPIVKPLNVGKESEGIVVKKDEPTLFAESASENPWEGLDLAGFREAVMGCQRCELGATRTNLVFGEGNPDADLMFIGEAPGRDEDMQGRPFVGRSGQLLTKMIEAMKLSREEVYIANILKCRPPNNRDPLPSEAETCTPYLRHQLKLIKPKIMCLLGRVAATTLLRSNESLARMRGTWHDFEGTKVMVTYHPAALLRNPNLKRAAWEDLKRLRRELDGTEL